MEWTQPDGVNFHFLLQRDTCMAKRKIQRPRLNQSRSAAIEALMGLFAVIRTLTLKINITSIVVCSSYSTRGGVWGSGFTRRSFLPSLRPSQLCHPRRFNMSGAHVFSGAHHFVLRDCTVNAASTVREKAIRYSEYPQADGVDLYRSTSITLATEEHLTRSFQSCQTQVFDSQAEQKSSPN